MRQATAKTERSHSAALPHTNNPLVVDYTGLQPPLEGAQRVSGLLVYSVNLSYLREKMEMGPEVEDRDGP